jgi:hypothetical protein
VERRHRLTEELVRIEHSLATKIRRFLSQKMNLVISVALFFPFIFLSVGVNEFVSASYFTDFFNPALSKAPRYPGKHQIAQPLNRLLRLKIICNTSWIRVCIRHSRVLWRL